MGAENSKPAAVTSQHVFSADAPVRFSSGLVDSLQNNTQTDSTRSKQQELAYQQRLTDELEKLREKEAQNLSELSKNLSGESEQPTDPSLTESLTEKISDATSSSATLAQKQKQREMSNASVTKEIEALKKKLDARKKLEQADPAVNKAKEDVANCLRTHDRRPLDCWKEVETFKKEVGRLEKDFVERTIR
ncbi:unnamed protein product [Periconia digitata]|uniref:DUF1690-domain-containing protein n=1 Tax=Periconia digitata TaxID=1303443 RepID=A0A9W4UMP8_9PLEO|nr:unnamed protein product [Periconia digitata]